MNVLLRLLAPRREAVVRLAREALLREGVPAGEIQFDERSFRLRLPGDHSIYLENLFEVCQRSWPWQRRAVVDHFIANRGGGDAAFPDDYEEAQQRLLVGVRDAFLFEVVELQCRLDGRPAPVVPRVPLGSRLAACLFVDSEHTTGMVNADQLAKWGQSFEDAFEVGLANLARRSTAPLVPIAPGVYRSPWQDCYDPARLLLSGTLGPLRLAGSPIAIAATWKCLLVTGEDDLPGIVTALAAAESVVEAEGRPMSALPLVRRGSGWAELALARGHPLEPRLREVRTLELGGLYRQQKEMLDGVHEREGTDVFVASYSGVRTKEPGSTRSTCVWSDGVLTLLPHTDSVVFCRESGGTPTVAGEFDHDVVQLHCGALLADAGHALRRYRVEAFPSAEQFEAMARSQALRGSPAR